MDYEIHPCDRHMSILSTDLTFERALQVADDCPDCRVVSH
jgi:hypothetical protein